jgi:hypothetical protein
VHVSNLLGERSGAVYEGARQRFAELEKSLGCEQVKKFYI